MALRHYPRIFVRHFAWWLRLVRIDVGENVILHLPVRISGGGKIRFGAGCRVAKNVSIACSSGSTAEFSQNCSLSEGVCLSVRTGCNARFREGVTIHQNCHLAAVGKWEIGTGTEIQTNCSITAREQEFEGGFIVGDQCYIGDASIIDIAGGVTIGDNVAIGPYCIIYTHDHEPEKDLDAIWKGKIKLGAVSIGRGAWIGSRVTILSGVKIGERSIVGAGAVVTSDVPAGCLALGVPARIVKALFEHPGPGLT